MEKAPRLTFVRWPLQIENKKGNCCNGHILTEFNPSCPQAMARECQAGSHQVSFLLPPTLPAANKNGSGSAFRHNLLSWLGVFGILLKVYLAFYVEAWSVGGPWKSHVQILYQVKGSDGCSGRRMWLEAEGAALSRKCHL